ncbi:putative DNA-binding transcriptional regulator YafY [Paenibacillus sp. LBL]|uniref:helix-turn-helix transcriptional regulator n=1 Tax=Paenibacillus sp. LBL TaxID=2940563 RepID=UPI0024748DBF|nr:YafY family protein [Paenibacillus sp. LBL]MDH6671205.1 putative DNA-binding transcriptional regulator YafY [Paenibacillus sp. LBL]
MAKLDYLLSILWLLRSHEKMTAEQLAERLELSVRTVYRYIDTLGVSGVPIISESGHGGGFRLPDTFLSVPLFFELTELKAMEHSALLARHADYPFTDALEKALSKIEHRLQESQLEDLRRHVGSINVLSPSQGALLQPLLRELEQAVATRETLILHYAKSSSSSAQERHIDPYGLIYRLGKWYLTAYCHTRKALRVFRVDRMKSLSLTGRTFEMPEHFSVQDYLSNVHEHQDQVTMDTPSVTVRLQGHTEALDAICNQWFLQPYLVVRRTDDEAEFHIQPDRMMKYMPYLLLSFGRSINVLEPKELRSALFETARDLANYYDE